MMLSPINFSKDALPLSLGMVGSETFLASATERFYYLTECLHLAVNSPLPMAAMGR